MQYIDFYFYEYINRKIFTGASEVLQNKQPVNKVIV